MLILGCLLDHHADIDPLETGMDRRPSFLAFARPRTAKTPLYEAVHAEDVEMVLLLLLKGADAKKSNANGYSGAETPFELLDLSKCRKPELRESLMWKAWPPLQTPYSLRGAGSRLEEELTLLIKFDLL